MALGIASVLTGGVLAVILAGAFWGALIGGALGGVTDAVKGGITSIVLKIVELCRPSNSYEIQLPEIYVLLAKTY